MADALAAACLAFQHCIECCSVQWPRLAHENRAEAAVARCSAGARLDAAEEVHALFEVLQCAREAARGDEIATKPQERNRQRLRQGAV